LFSAAEAARGNVIDLPVTGRVRIAEVFNGLQIGGAWWTNTALVQQLGLTDDQKTKIERAYENHRQKIMSETELLDKEEAQLAKLLEADLIDRNAVLGEVRPRRSGARRNGERKFDDDVRNARNLNSRPMDAVAGGATSGMWANDFTL